MEFKQIFDECLFELIEKMEMKFITDYYRNLICHWIKPNSRVCILPFYNLPYACRITSNYFKKISYSTGDRGRFIYIEPNETIYYFKYYPSLSKDYHLLF